MKRFVLAIALLSMTVFISAQNVADFGFRAGFSTSKIYTNLSNYNQENITGYQAGVFFRFFIKKKILFQPEGYFVKKGGNLFHSEGSNEDEISFTINSFDVPVLVGFKLVDVGFSRLMIYTGPVMSFPHNKTVNFTENGQQDAFKSDEQLIHSMNWGYQVGGSLDILMFTLDVRYEWGLTDIYDGSDTFKPNVFLMGLGVRIF
jgi:hypothetical protein